MRITTKDESRPTVEVPDDEIDQQTLIGTASDRRWWTWSCPGCGATSAGYGVRTDLVLCALCTFRLAQGRPLLDGKSLWAEAMEVKAAGSRAQISRTELEDAEAVYAAALVDDVPMVVGAGGVLRQARCAVCRRPLREAEAARFGSATLYHRRCLGLD